MDFFERPLVHLFDQSISGRVESAVTSNHQGRVKCQGVSWKASLYLIGYPHPLMPDQMVDVIGREGNTLLILPESK